MLKYLACEIYMTGHRKNTDSPNFMKFEYASSIFKLEKRTDVLWFFNQAEIRVIPWEKKMKIGIRGEVQWNILENLAEYINEVKRWLTIIYVFNNTTKNMLNISLLFNQSILIFCWNMLNNSYWNAFYNLF